MRKDSLSLLFGLILAFHAPAQTGASWTLNAVELEYPFLTYRLNNVRSPTFTFLEFHGQLMNRIWIHAAPLQVTSVETLSEWSTSSVTFPAIGPFGIDLNLGGGSALRLEAAHYFNPRGGFDHISTLDYVSGPYAQSFPSFFPPAQVGDIGPLFKHDTPTSVSYCHRLPWQDWGLVTLQLGYRWSSYIDVFGSTESMTVENVDVDAHEYLGRFRPQPYGVFISLSASLGSGWRLSSLVSDKFKSQEELDAMVESNKVRELSRRTGNKPAGIQINVTKEPKDIRTVFVIQGNSAPCDSTAASAEALRNYMEARLMGRYEILERQHIEKILAEQRLGISGAVFEWSAAEAGRLKGADGIVLCDVGCLQGKELLTVKLVDCESAVQQWSGVGLDATAAKLIDAILGRIVQP